MKYKITLVVGDWSDDGHGKTRSFLISSNLSEKEIDEAHNKAKKLLGFDFVEDVACDCDDHKISKIHFEKLKQYIDFDLDDAYGNDSYKCCGIEDYVNLYLVFVKVGNKNFKYKFVKDNSKTINIGGYGLFY